MLPTFFTDDPMSVAHGDPEAFADGNQERPGGAHGADSANISLGEFGLPMVLSQWASAVAFLVCGILFWCRPTKIGGPVVVAVSILMRSLMKFRRLRSVKRRAYDYVYSLGLSMPHIEHLIFPSLDDGSQYGTRIEATRSGSVSDPSVHRADSPKARRFIARMPWDRSPFFHVLHRNGFSPPALVGSTALAARV